MADLLKKANKVISNMEKAYGKKQSNRMLRNVFLNTYGYFTREEQPANGTLLDQYLETIIGVFTGCENIAKEKKERKPKKSSN